MEKVIEKFEKLWMGRKWEFLGYFTSSPPQNPEQPVAELYEECKKLPMEEQEQVRNYVCSWAANVTREEMFVGAREEQRLRQLEEKKKRKFK